MSDSTTREASPLVFITGASSGIGQALAARYAAAGWRLALVARRVAEVEQWAMTQGLPRERFAIYAADVQDVGSIVAAAQACIASQGLPDVVIANAGISVGMDTTQRDDLAVMSETLATNVVGVAATFHAFVAPMRAPQRQPGRHRQRGGHPRPARAWRLLRKQVGGGGVLRVPAR